MDQCSGNAGIDTTGQAKNDIILADFLADRVNRFRNVIRHVPVGFGTADVVYKTVDDRLALYGMSDFRMELQGIEFLDSSAIPAIGQESFDNITVKPGGISVTLSP